MAILAVSLLFVQSLLGIVNADTPLWCHEVKIPTDVTANHINLASNTHPAIPAFDGFSNNNSSFTHVVNRTFTIAGRYCEPNYNVRGEPPRVQTLQILVHGWTYTRDYWTGLGPPGEGWGGETFSWVNNMADHGFATLAIDRLGNGASDKPNGFLDAQLPANAETIHEVVKAARDGTIPGVEIKFEKIILVGHGLGSLALNLLTSKYPADADALVLTGFTNRFILSWLGLIVSGGFYSPKAPHQEHLWGGADLGYLRAGNRDQQQFLFFGNGNVSFEQDMLTRQMNTTGTVTIGELISSFFTPIHAPEYTGPVMLINGNRGMSSRTDTVACADECRQYFLQLGYDPLCRCIVWASARRGRSLVS